MTPVMAKSAPSRGARAKTCVEAQMTVAQEDQERHHGNPDDDRRFKVPIITRCGP